MQLHDFHIQKTNRSKKRIGRGGKRGTTSGRGQKGQKSRAGRKMRPAIRDLISRIPKRRGFRNKPTVAPSFVLQIRDIAGFSGEIDRDFLKKQKLISGRYRGAVKVLGSGKIEHVIVLKGIAASKGAQACIEKAGGKVI